jgi:hypothetical protein
MRFFRDEKFEKEIRPALHVNARLYDAHRWLAEFDEFLGPLWDYLNGKKSIETARDEMRRAVAADAEKIAPGLLECKAKLESAEATLKQFKWALQSTDRILEKK